MMYLIKYVCTIETEDLHLGMFKTIAGINKLKTLTKQISSECKCRFDGRNYTSDQWWNNDKSQCECKNRHVCEKDYVRNSSTCSCENGKYLASIMDNSAIMCDEVKESNNEETKTIRTNFNEKKGTCKTQNLYTLLAFLLMIIAFLIAVINYCCLIKYRAKQKHLLLFDETNDEIREVLY